MEAQNAILNPEDRKPPRSQTSGPASIGEQVFWAADSRNHSILMNLLQDNPGTSEAWEHPSDWGKTALLAACYNGDALSVKLLLEDKANISAQPRQFGHNPIEYAEHWKHGDDWKKCVMMISKARDEELKNRVKRDLFEFQASQPPNIEATTNRIVSTKGQDDNFQCSLLQPVLHTTIKHAEVTFKIVFGDCRWKCNGIYIGITPADHLPRGACGADSTFVYRCREGHKRVDGSWKPYHKNRSHCNKDNGHIDGDLIILKYDRDARTLRVFDRDGECSDEPLATDLPIDKNLYFFVDTCSLAQGAIIASSKANLADMSLDITDISSVWSALGEQNVVQQIAMLTWQDTSCPGIQTASVGPESPAYAKINELWQSSPGNHRLSRVELLNIPLGAKAFKTMIERLGQGRGTGAGGPLNPANYSDADYVAGLEKLKRTFVPSADFPTHANAIFTWHGTKHDIAHEVAGNGLRPLRSTDGGYFGGGTYTSVEAWYAAQYSLPRFGGSPNANGEYVLLLCVTAIGAAYVVTRGRDYNCKTLEGFSDMFGINKDDSKCLKSGYDTHFVPVRYYGKRLPTGTFLPHDVDFQAVAESNAEAHEVVSYSFNQVLPVALIYFFES